MNIQLRLSILQFLQFFIWGSWFVTAGTYMMQTLHFSGREVGLIYVNNAIAATVTPLILGILADRFFSVEKLLALLHLVGGILLCIIAYVQSFEWFYGLTLLYVLCYTPTFSLTSALCFHHVTDAKRDFPRVRVWGLHFLGDGWLINWLFAIRSFSNAIQNSGCVFYPPWILLFDLTCHTTTGQERK